MTLSTIIEILPVQLFIMKSKFLVCSFMSVSGETETVGIFYDKIFPMSMRWLLKKSGTSLVATIIVEPWLLQISLTIDDFFYLCIKSFTVFHVSFMFA